MLKESMFVKFTEGSEKEEKSEGNSKEADRFRQLERG
jgi:hypothetical protein